MELYVNFVLSRKEGTPFKKSRVGGEREREEACSVGCYGGSVILDLNLCYHIDPSLSPRLPGTGFTFILICFFPFIIAVITNYLFWDFMTLFLLRIVLVFID